MQAKLDRGYTFICVYQDHLIRFVILRSLRLRHKCAEVVDNVLLDIFIILG